MYESPALHEQDDWSRSVGMSGRERDGYVASVVPGRIF
jgi:hypothetical protein